MVSCVTLSGCAASRARRRRCARAGRRRIRRSPATCRPAGGSRARPSRRVSDRPRTSLCASMIGSGMSSVGLAARVAEHQPLVAGAAGVHALADVARLLVDRREHRARLGVEAELRAGVADVGDDVADDPLKSMLQFVVISPATRVPPPGAFGYTLLLLAFAAAIPMSPIRWRLRTSSCGAALVVGDGGAATVVGVHTRWLRRAAARDGACED